MSVINTGVVEFHVDTNWGYTLRTVNGIPLTFTRNHELTENDPRRKAKKAAKLKRQEEAEEEL